MKRTIAEQVTGILDNRTPEERKREGDILYKATMLHLIGVFDEMDNTDSYEKQKILDREKALEYLEQGKEIPADLLEKILKYRDADFKKVNKE